MIPVMVVRDMDEAIRFYTGPLDFQLHAAMPDEKPFYAVLVRGQEELHLTLPPPPLENRHGHCAAIILCDDVDAVFARFQGRGLVTPTRPDSPVHLGPLNQSWGTREVYIDDPSGNTLIFQQR